MRTLNFGTEATIGATLSLLRQSVRSARGLINRRDVSDRNVSATPHFRSRRLAPLFLLACIFAASAALIPTAGHAQMTPNSAATGAPAITGTAQVGQVLSVDTSGIEDLDGNTRAENGDIGFAYTHKWFRVDSDGTSSRNEIAGETASTYTLVSEDEGKKLIVEASFTDDEGNSEGSLASDAYPETETVQEAPTLTLVTIEADQTSAVFLAGLVSFTISRPGDTADELEVAVELKQTHQFLDTSSLSKAVTIAAGDSDATLTIPVSQFTSIPRGKPVASGTLTATVTPGTEYDVGTPGSADVNIVAALMFSFDRDSYEVDESDGALSFKLIARTGQGAAVPTDSVVVSVITDANDATSPTDYSALSEEILFSPADFVADGDVYEGEAAVSVEIVDDDDEDSGETFKLNLERSPALQNHHANFVDTDSNSCGSVCSVNVTITDNDSAAPELVMDPSSLEIDEAGSGTFTVKLATLPMADVNVSVSSDDTGAATVSPTDLTFTSSDWSDAQIVTVSGVNDADASDETLTVSFTAMSDDPDYQVITASVSLSVVDDEPEVTVQFSKEDYSVDEGDTQSITVTLSADPEREVIIPLTTTEQGGASWKDYGGVYSWLKFLPGETSKSFIFSAIQDFDDDDGESVKIAFGDLPSRVRRGATDENTVSIIDDDFGDPAFNVGTLGAFRMHTDDGDGNLLVGACTGSGSFRIIWGAREDRRGADEWDAYIITHGGMSAGGYSFRESPGLSPGHYEMNGTVNLQGEGSLSIRVRGRFGDIWGTWSSPVGLYCLDRLNGGS